jgi:hypothetical protein
MAVSVMETKKVPEQLLVKRLNEITEGKFIS